MSIVACYLTLYQVYSSDISSNNRKIYYNPKPLLFVTLNILTTLTRSKWRSNSCE